MQSGMRLRQSRTLGLGSRDHVWRVRGHPARDACHLDEFRLGPPADALGHFVGRDSRLPMAPEAVKSDRLADECAPDLLGDGSLASTSEAVDDVVERSERFIHPGLRE